MSFKEYFANTNKLSLSLLIVSPLLLLYELGILLAQPGVRNGADVSFRRIFGLLGPNGEWVWLGFLGLVLLVCVILVYREKLPAHLYFFPVITESLIYALIFGPLVLLLQHRLGAAGMAFRECAVSSLAESSSFMNFIFAIGAGVYEEALFRLALLSLLYYQGKKLCEFLALPVWIAAAGAVLLSSIAFSAFHHVGEFAAPFSWAAFAFRSLAGGVLGTIFILRGFGVAVYTHAFYDILYLFTFS